MNLNNMPNETRNETGNIFNLGIVFYITNKSNNNNNNVNTMVQTFFQSCLAILSFTCNNDLQMKIRQYD